MTVKWVQGDEAQRLGVVMTLNRVKAYLQNLQDTTDSIGEAVWYETDKDRVDWLLEQLTNPPADMIKYTYKPSNKRADMPKPPSKPCGLRCFVLATLLALGLGITAGQQIYLMQKEATMSYDNTNKGALFKNDRQTNDRQPNLKGFMNVDGVEYWVSGWTKTVQNGPRAGEKMVSFTFEPKEDNPPAQPSSQQGNQPEPIDDFDDDIPF